MCDIDFDDYEISEHRHVFAAWAAARASSTSPNCRYEVWIAKVLLDNLGFGSDLLCPDDLPSKDELDDKHRAWRKKMVEDAGPLIEKVYAEKVEAAREKAAKEKKKFTKPKKPVFTHGVAAKLLNVYVKSVFVCGFGDVHERAGVAADRRHPGRAPKCGRIEYSLRRADAERQRLSRLCGGHPLASRRIRY